ncbi:unconventional myosin-XVB-like [Frankliniella occidentalis]|uniref:Unconventional myosin-XVB-like n=1 Tax=Frankliniella occidentalis TaxID=133901 RepID=A0A9C6XTF4_FRAOC|nr:unconventional myosin-XVB-like [Frankliniella occidentalis]
MPPPPEYIDPSETRPFLDPYGRAKTVRIGKWRWPPPQDNGETADSFLHFKLRQQQRKVSPQKSSHDASENGEGIEWEEFEMDSSPTSLEPPRKSSSTSNLSNKRDVADKNKNNIVRSNLDLHSASSPSSVGKLRISSEMRSKLELVTANHSLRSTTKTEKPALSLLNNMQQNGHGHGHGQQRTVSKLEDNRKLLLEQQLAGRWGSIDSVDAGTRKLAQEDRTEMQPTSNVRSQVERMEKPINATPHSANTSMTGWKPAPPPPPIIPHYNGDAHAQTNHHTPASRTSSFYSQSNTPGIPQPRSPPPPIQPVRQHDGQRDLFGRGGSPAGRGGSPAGRDHRRASVSTHHTDVMERIEIEESSEFLQPVDSNPPLVLDRRDLDRSVETTKTKLFGPSSAAYFTYNRTAWRLNVKKEVFAPNEALSTPLALHLVFCQVVQDTLSPNCIRIGREERTNMRKMLDNYGVTLNNLQSAHHKNTIKKNVVDMAKQWNVYFSRIFPVSGGHQNPDVQFLAISHSGVRLLRKEKSVPHDYLQVLDTFTFDEIAEVTMPKTSSVQFMLSAGGRVLLYTHRANQVQTMLHRFILEACKGAQEYVRGVQDHVSRDQSLLCFRKGDVIRLVNRDQHLQKGWLYGSLNGRSGLFPCEFVEALARNQHGQSVSPLTMTRRALETPASPKLC